MGSSIEFIKAYTDNYLKKLAPQGGPLTQRDDALVESYSSVDDLLGKNSRFLTFLQITMYYFIIKGLDSFL